ncbi:unnamed protein product [Rotaria sp. Silwood1]|nr:unnamed protein product [Rotaria sp. Silwood1]CAF1236553.1 unnamed protein product [Rotaria sp. Silwood1]CAF1399187.1 unnamed protein product [Rotaria sp. Silwood1]CAF1600384.1 unnamed protein product [Rotaria sp. Silwood1]CAF3804030.1 unnamed protein product [Rotaria sp. Silwood1]
MTNMVFNKPSSEKSPGTSSKSTEKNKPSKDEKKNQRQQNVNRAEDDFEQEISQQEGPVDKKAERISSKET